MNLIDRLLDLGISVFITTWVLSLFGVELRSILAVAGVGALAISLAARPLVQNLISGMLIFIANPFNIGDKIVFKGVTGKISRIGWINTFVITDDGLPRVIPNDNLSSASLINKTRVDLETPVKLPLVLSPIIAGKENITEAITAMEAALQFHPEINSDKPVAVRFKGTVAEGAAVKFDIHFVFDTSGSTSNNRDQKISDILSVAYAEAQRHGLGSVPRPLPTN